MPAATTRFESEAEWPALLNRGSAYPIHHSCASRSRALRLVPGTVVAVPVRWPGARATRLTVGWAAKTALGAQVRFRWSSQADSELASFQAACEALQIAGPVTDSDATLLVELLSGEGALDFLDVGAAGVSGSSDSRRR